MASTLQPHSQFTVTSGCLCYGHLHNMCHGLTKPIQPFPPALERHPGGTVKAQILHYNIAAVNGTWLAYELMDTKTPDPLRVAWLVCHADVNPETEVDKILRVSGSPYEHDSGSQWHDETTVAEGVLPINRYDWGYYDERCKGEVPDFVEMDDHVWDGEDVGLVDYGHAREYIDNWKHLKPRQRENQPRGIWMGIRLEYMFGRFGFTDDHAAARSFLWFTTNTDFTRTAFAGQQRTLRVFESGQDRFKRLLREGHNFDGVSMMQDMIPRHGKADKVPPETELCGPYDAEEYIVGFSDVDDVLSTMGPCIATERGIAGFAACWGDACLQLVNEAMLSYLEVVIAPASCAHDSIASAAAALFPQREDVYSMDQDLYDRMTRPDSCPPKINRVAMGKKIREFLVRRRGDVGLVSNDAFTQGVAAVVALILHDVFRAGYDWRTGGDTATVPRHVRGAMFMMDDVLERVRYSRVFWNGGVGWVVHAGEDVI